MKKIILLAIAAVLVIIAAVLLVACSKKEEEEPPVCGGWSKEETELTEDELAIFNDAMSKEVVDTQFKPKKIIGRQVVAGMNYKFLCEQGDSEWVVRVFHGLDGESEVTDIYEYKE